MESESKTVCCKMTVDSQYSVVEGACEKKVREDTDGR